jgi:ornithine cyclodeaminase/alanine dehydrogenase-like protein (mu-crystallin family)
MTLLLKVNEVTALIDLNQAIKITENALVEQTRGRVGVHPPYHLDVPGGALRVVSGVLLDSERMGIRVGPALNLTPPGGSRHHVAMLYHTDGTLMAMVAYPFTTLRTGASLGVAAKHLAPEKIATLGLVGTGRNALALLEGTLAVRDVGTIKVFSRSAEGRQKFAEDAAAKLRCAVAAAESCQEVVSEADMVLVATSSLEPVFESSWVKKGCLVASMGPIGELPRDMFLKADRRFVSNMDQEKTPLRPSFLNTQVKEGKLRWEDVDELGAVVSGGKSAPDGARDITVFHESAGGAGDIVFADWCYQEAVRRGIGQKVSFV